MKSLTGRCIGIVDCRAVSLPSIRPRPEPPRPGRVLGRVGAAGNKAVVESPFWLQNNVLDDQQWTTRAELRIAIVPRVERTYRRRRRQSGLGRLTPVESETIMTSSAALIA